MLSKEDLKKIREVVSNTLSTLEHSYYDYPIDLIDINEVNAELDYNKIIFIDSSYAHNIIGPISYIYIRAAGISEDNILQESKLYIFTDTFFTVKTKNNLDKLSLQELAEILSKKMEYSLAHRYDADYTILDGSILADYIIANKNYEFINSQLDKEYKEFQDTYKYLLLNKRLLSIAKRIVQAHFITNNENVSDFIILLNKFPDKEFITNVYTKNIENSEIFDNTIQIKACYFRARLNDHIYRLESNQNIKDSELFGFVKKFIWEKRSYPFGLKMAHYKSKVTSREKKIIEDIIRKELGLSKSIDIETK